MKVPEIIRAETSAELAPGYDNPRNSEGDFAVLQNGLILFAYSRYHGSSAEDEAPCDIAGLISRDGGNTFEPLSKPLISAKEHNTENLMSVSFARLQSGTLCIFYLAKFGASSAYYMRRITDEENLTLGEAETCIEPRDDIYYVINNCRVFTLPDGRLLIPAARHKIVGEGNGRRGEYFGTCRIFGCDTDGRNWHAVSEIIEMPYPGHSETGLQEPGLSLLPDGRLYAYFRTDRCFQYEAFSCDGGVSWSVPVPSVFTAPESPMLIVKNPYSGIYYALWNPVPNYNGRVSEEVWCHAGRFPFVMAQSENGTDYSDFTFVEDIPDHGYCYPAVHFLSEKEMLMSYCCGGKDDGKCLSRTRIRKITLR